MTNNTYQKYCKVIDEWFVNKFNGAKAYRKFYKNVKKNETATVNFSKILAMPEMKAYIDGKHEKASKIINTTHEGILRELLNYVEFDMRNTLGLSIEQIKELPIEIGRVITGHKTKTKRHYDKEGNLLYEDESIELKFFSKERAIEMINKHIGFYKVDNEQKASEINIVTTNEKHMSIVADILNGKK